MVAVVGGTAVPALAPAVGGDESFPADGWFVEQADRAMATAATHTARASGFILPILRR
jgi:hypothetical protein